MTTEEEVRAPQAGTSQAGTANASGGDNQAIRSILLSLDARLKEVTDRLQQVEANSVASAITPLVQAFSGAVPGTSATPTAPGARVQMRDIELDHFFGNNDKTSSYIHVDFLKRLFEWIDASEGRLRDSKLPEALWVPKLLSALRGPAERAFRAKYADTNKTEWTLDNVREALVSLVPNSTYHFFNLAMNMVFRSNRLPDDILTFATYVRYAGDDLGDTNRPNKIIWQLFKDKIIAAHSNFFDEALNTYGTVVANGPMHQYIQAAHEVAKSIMCDHADFAKDTGGNYTAKASSKRKAETGPAVYDKKPRVGKETKRLSEDDRELLKKYQRCFKCAYFCKNYDEIKSHRCSPDKFQKRFGILKSLVEKNVDPNERIRSDK